MQKCGQREADRQAGQRYKWESISLSQLPLPKPQSRRFGENSTARRTVPSEHWIERVALVFAVDRLEKPAIFSKNPRWDPREKGKACSCQRRACKAFRGREPQPRF